MIEMILIRILQQLQVDDVVLWFNSWGLLKTSNSKGHSKNKFYENVK
jgi:hypothetical protein